jgi:uroporphyrin-III C-methyltransferase
VTRNAKTGTVYLVGAGPGAPDLLTVRAVRLLGEADIVFHDALVPAEVLLLAAKAQKVAVGKRCGKHSTAQRFINKRLLDAAREHRVVVRLKGGDPMLFGRAHEEISFLEDQNIKVEVVPGITSALAASAELKISLTRRGTARSVAFVTPRLGEGEAPSNWARAVAAADTAVLYMAATDAQAVVRALSEAGVKSAAPIVVAESVSLAGRALHTGTLADLPRLVARCSGGPALILIGEVFEAAQVLAELGPVRRTASHSA